MTIASTNDNDIGLIKESVAGTTPSTPTFQILPIKSGAPKSNISTAASETINKHRMIDDLVVVDLDVDGEISYELSYSSWKTVFQSLMRSAVVTANVSATDISVTAATRTFGSTTTDFTSENISVGSTIKVAGFTDSANNGLFYVESVSANAIVVEETTLVDEAAGDTIAINCEYSANGTSNGDSYSFVKRVSGIDNETYFYYRGCQLNTASLNFNTGSLIDGNIGLYGLSEEVTETEISGSNYTDVGEVVLMNAVSSVTNVDVSGLPGAQISSATVNINNNIQPAKAVGTLGAIALKAFTLEVTGEISIYFEDKSIYDAYLNSSSFSIRLVMQDSAGNSFVVNIPKSKFESLESPLPGKDQYFVSNGSFRALRDTTTNSAISLSLIDA